MAYPSISEMMMMQQLGKQSNQLPGINPAGPNPQQAPGLGQRAGGALNGLDAFLGKPGGMMLMNLLAQQGYSKMPQSRLGAVGRAALMTSQQQAGQSQAEAKRKLMEAQGKYYSDRAEQSELNPTGGNVQTSFKGSNGNMHIITRNGDTKDTGVAFNENVKFFEQADGSVIGVDSSSGQRIGTVVTPKEAADATRRKDQTQAAIDLPVDLANLDSTISKIDTTIDKIDEVKGLAVDENVGIESRIRGDLPGFLGGGPRKLKQSVKSIQAEFGFDTLQKMRAASKSGGALGQVSERELDLLINALRSIDIEGDPETLQTNLEAVATHYRNYKAEINKMKNLLREKAGQQPETSNDFEGFSIATD